MLLNLVLAESALELVPKEVAKSSAAKNDALRRGTDASGTLLDRSLHHSAMAGLRDSEKRGRPDLVHAALLSITGTPLYLDGQVKVFVHTHPDITIEIAEKTRVPKSFFRFRGLMEQVFVEEPSRGLLSLRKMGMDELLRETISPSHVFGMSVQGKQMGLDVLSKSVVESMEPCVVIGGFPHGHFSAKTIGLFDDLVRMNRRPLEAHIVAARLIYEVERAMERTND